MSLPQHRQPTLAELAWTAGVDNGDSGTHLCGSPGRSDGHELVLCSGHNPTGKPNQTNLATLCRVMGHPVLPVWYRPCSFDSFKHTDHVSFLRMTSRGFVTVL